MKQFLTVGIKEIIKDKWVYIKNIQYSNKPSGGLWSIEYTPNEEFKSAWLEWFDSEMPDWAKNYGVLFELKKDAKVYTIDSYKDLENIYNKYPIENKTKVIDYEKVSKEYDAIILTDKGQCETGISIINLYGWNCENILIMNFDCIINSKYILNFRMC